MGRFFELLYVQTVMPAIVEQFQMQQTEMFHAFKIDDHDIAMPIRYAHQMIQRSHDHLQDHHIYEEISREMLSQKN